jgi:hypothetical protein
MLPSTPDVALGDLPFHAVHKKGELAGFLVPFSLLAHFLDILRWVGDTIRHGEAP